MSPQADKAIAPHGWSIDLRSTVLCGIGAALVLAVFALLLRTPRDEKWLLAQGVVRDMKVVPDQALETKWGGQAMWRAEYKVGYIVGSREFSVWADSGIRGESEASVRLALSQSAPSCRVRYNLQQPTVSTADCR